MADDENKIRVEFAPGCFDDFDGTQEELEEFIAEITRLAESGELIDNAMVVTEKNIDDLPEDLLEWLEGLLEMDSEDVEIQRKNKLN